MENYKKYISEIKKFDMKPAKSFPDLSHINFIKNRSPEEIESLMNYALGDFTLLPSGDLERELTEVEQIEKVFSEFDAHFPSLLRNFLTGKLGMQDLKLKLKTLFRFIRLDREIITVKFMVGLYISVLNKQNSILTFKNKIQNLLASQPLSLK